MQRSRLWVPTFIRYTTWSLYQWSACYDGRCGNANAGFENGRAVRATGKLGIAKTLGADSYLGHQSARSARTYFFSSNIPLLAAFIAVAAALLFT